jgi:hypothetical protein
MLHPPDERAMTSPLIVRPSCSAPPHLRVNECFKVINNYLATSTNAGCGVTTHLGLAAASAMPFGLTAG